MENSRREPEEVVEVRRKLGGLRKIITSADRCYLVPDEPGTKKYLKVGSLIDGSDRELLEDTLARPAGIAFSYQLLSRRDRTEWEMRRLLRDEGIEKLEVVDYIVETLRGQGYLDDRRFAREGARFGKEYRRSGPVLLRNKLRMAGISEDLVEEALRQTFLPGEEKELALRLAGEKLAAGVSADRARAVRRIHRFLTRRGFSGEVVNDVCARILRGEVSGDRHEPED
ncbi:MAG: regulatory protein RecX [Candidatus Krumholzibacteriota bacterium]|nr:regulatory protein RecX [Candidatus Krumholzibacteriota bacterium]